MDDPGSRVARFAARTALLPLVALSACSSGHATRSARVGNGPTSTLAGAGTTLTIAAVRPESTVANLAIPNFPDAKFFTFGYRGKFYGVEAGGGANLLFPMSGGGSLGAATPMAGLSPGPAYFDQKGVWLIGAYLDPLGVLHGFYHAEHPLSRPGASSEPHKSLAYAESRDGGKTWTKSGYPSNQIITGQVGDINSQAGDGMVIQVGDYLYLYYTEAGAGPDARVALARSALVDGGRPGTWFKYYCPASGSCAFTQPGIGGKASRLTNLDPGSMGSNVFVSFDTTIGRYVAVGKLTGDTIPLGTSVDGVTWSPTTTAPLPPPPPGWQNVYPSLVGADGNSTAIGNQVWLYYVRLDLATKRDRLWLRRLLVLQ